MNLLPVLEPIRDDLGAVEARMLAAVSETLEPLSSALRLVISSGGKRLRPALVILAARVHSWDPGPAVSLAAAVEMLHAATLIHDDTIDEATLRRGHKTLNATWNRAATILAGDLLFARSAALAAEVSNTRVMSIFANTLLTICEGELRQMLALFDWSGSLEGYYQRIYSKTASLFAASCEAGAVLGGASEARISALRDYGHQVGMAFQIVDDILDFTGEEERLGKPAGSDLRQGSATLPVYYFLQHGGDKGLVEAALDRGARREQAVAELVAAIVSSPAIAACQQEAEAFARRAVEALAPLGVESSRSDGPYRQALCDLAGVAIARQS